jgi:hypothetical protein
MSNSEVISFDVLRGLDGASPARRWFVLGAIVAAFAAIGLLTYAAVSPSSVSGVRVRAKTPGQALTILCADFRSAERSYLSASANEDYATPATRGTFEHELVALAFPDTVFRSPAMRRFEQDAVFLENFLSENRVIGGPSLADLHSLCGQ